MHRPVRDVYFPRSRAARRRESGARASEKERTDSRRDRRSEFRVREFEASGVSDSRLQGKVDACCVCNMYGRKSALVLKIATLRGNLRKGRAFMFARAPEIREDPLTLSLSLYPSLGAANAICCCSARERAGRSEARRGEANPAFPHSLSLSPSEFITGYESG